MNHETDKIVARIEAGIGTLTFNHPEKRNALSLEMWKGMGDVLERFDADPAVSIGAS